MRAAKPQTAELEELAEIAGQVVEARRRLTALEGRRDRTIKRLNRRGVKPGVLAKASRMTAGRVSQVLGKEPPARTHASKSPAAPPDPQEGAAETSPAAASDLDAPAVLLSEVATSRAFRHYDPRASMVADWQGGECVAPGSYDLAGVADLSTIGKVLEYAYARSCQRVFLTGPRPGATAEAVRGWYLGELGEGWAHGRHHLSDPELPVGRYTHASGWAVEVHRAACWFGETKASPPEVYAAFTYLAGQLRDFPGQPRLLSTPTTMGRDLWQRLIPEHRTYPVMSDEVREIIAATAGQGRTELLPAHHDRRPGFVYLDGRFMYAGLTWGLPVAPIRWWTRAQVGRMTEAELGALLRGRGRWLVTYRVPQDWPHVGLLMTPADVGWCYPSSGALTYTTWADGAEIDLARRQGWTVKVLEGMTWAEGKPLNTITERVIRAREQAEKDGQPLVVAAWRAMLLYLIGGMAQRSRRATHVGDQAALAASAGDPINVRQDAAGRLVWDTLEAAPAGPYSHPEWAATIWARARVRLLAGPGGTGALHLPPESIIAFRTDAIYTTTDPGWADDGKVGRFRRKGRALPTSDWPSTWDDLFALRRIAEGLS